MLKPPITIRDGEMPSSCFNLFTRVLILFHEAEEVAKDDDVN